MNRSPPPPSSVHSSASGCGLVCIFRRPSKVKDPPTSLFSTISDPSVCMCEQDKACVGLKEEVAGNHRAVGEMSSVCRLQFHHTTPSIAVNAPRGHSSISIIYTYDHDLRACQKKPLGDISPVALPCPRQPTLCTPSLL